MDHYDHIPERFFIRIKGTRNLYNQYGIAVKRITMIRIGEYGYEFDLGKARRMVI